MATTGARRRGRPSGLTPKSEALLLQAIERGLPYKQAAALAGISYATFNRWRFLGSKENASPEYCHFCNQLEASEARAMDLLMQTIRSAATEQRDWKAAAWMLERRHAKEWGRKEQVSIQEVTPDDTFLRLLEEYPPSVIESIQRKTAERDALRSSR